MTAALATDAPDSVRALSDAALSERILALVTIERQVHAELLDALEVYDRRGIALMDGNGSTAAWLRSSTNVEPAEATRWVGLARDLADALPATRAALQAGEISPRHAQVIASLRGDVSDEALAAAEPHLAQAARDHDARELRGWVKHVREACAPERLARDEARQFDQRAAYGVTTFDGMGVGRWLLHPAGHETVMTALHALSAPATGDDRTHEQRLADALVSLAEIAMRSGELPQTGGAAAQVTIAVHVAADDLTPGGRGLRAAEFGFGAVTGSSWARRFTCDASISRVVFGPGGEVLDAGRASRLFTPAQRRAVVARDGGCVWPGCRAPAAWSEAHHVRHWSEGGVTSVDNAALLCGRHHDRVHAHHHAIVVKPDGRRTVDLRAESDSRYGSRPCRRPPPNGP